MAGISKRSSTKGYGVGGVAVLCETLTDNRNRTAPEIRKIFELGGGKLGSTGCVAWMFESKGLFLIPTSATDEDALMELALEAGADDVTTEDDQFQVTCDPSVFQAVAEALEAAEIKSEVKEISRIPENTVDVESVGMAQKVLKMIERLDDHDDVQSVSANFNIPDEIMAQMEAE